MNYPPNTTHWNLGDLVLHDADAKEPRMFMRVVGYTKDGLCRTKYVSNSRSRGVLVNPIDALHGISLWGFSDKSSQEDFELVRRWNRNHPIGTLVEVKFAKGLIEQHRTVSEASLLQGDMPVILLEGIDGYCSLDQIKAIEASSR